MLRRFSTADHELAAKEFLVVQFFNRPFCFVDGLHLNESETFGALVVSVADYFCILDVTDSVKELEEIALGGVERQIANVKTRRCHFDRFRFSGRPLLVLVSAVRRCLRGPSCLLTASEKCRDSLPECFFGRLQAHALVARMAAPSSRAAALVARASPG